MIRTFADKTTAAVFAGERVRKLPPELLQVVRRKLAWLNEAEQIESLRVPPGNRLEALRGDRNGQYSNRINDPWRICFRFEDGHAYDVEIVDYH